MKKPMLWAQQKNDKELDYEMAPGDMEFEEVVSRSTGLYNLLINKTSGAVLTMIVSAGEECGLEAWSKPPLIMVIFPQDDAEWL